MSFADYLSLRNYLDRPGETVLDGRVTVTYRPNDDEDLDALASLANEAAVLLGLHDRCGACGGEGGVGSFEGSTRCEYCNGEGTQSAGSFTSAIDRLALNDLKLRCVGYHGWADGGDFSDADCIYRLPRAPCPECKGDGHWHPGGGEEIQLDKAGKPWSCQTCRELVTLKPKDLGPAHEWKRPRSFAQGEQCDCGYEQPAALLDPPEWVYEDDCMWCEDEGVIAHGLGLWGWRDGDSGDGPGWDYPFGVLPFAEESESDDEIWQELFVVEVMRLYNRERTSVAYAAEVFADVAKVATERVALAREAVERADMGPWNHAGAVADPISPATV